MGVMRCVRTGQNDQFFFSFLLAPNRRRDMRFGAFQVWRRGSRYANWNCPIGARQASWPISNFIQICAVAGVLQIEPVRTPFDDYSSTPTSVTSDTHVSADKTFLARDYFPARTLLFSRVMTSHHRTPEENAVILDSKSLAS